MAKSRVIPTLMFVFTNILFAYKYSSRIIAYGLIVAVLYSALICLAIYNMVRIPLPPISRNLLLAIVACVSICWIGVLLSIETEHLRVDRWLMINTFLDNLLRGEFPYTPKPNSNIPGPFPFYFIVALPFYLVGEVGYLSLLAFMSFAYLLFRLFKDERIVVIMIAILVTSPSFLWEVCVRSTILANMIIVVWYSYFIEKVELNSTKKLITTGIVGGLVLSTRSIVAIPLAVYFSQKFIRTKEWSKLTVTASSVIIGFLLTILPLYLWNPRLFIQYNPIALQAGFLPIGAIPILLFTAVLLGIKARTSTECYRYSGILLFLTIVASFIRTVAEVGFSATLFESDFDISYFIFPIPFVLMSMPTRDAERGATGKAQRREVADSSPQP